MLTYADVYRSTLVRALSVLKAASSSAQLSQHMPDQSYAAGE
jgi:hypothetical protein